MEVLHSDTKTDARRPRILPLKLHANAPTIDLSITVVSGTAKVTISTRRTARARERECLHPSYGMAPLENPEKVPLEVIEVQIGSDLREDAIVRSNDIYHRSPDESR